MSHNKVTGGEVVTIAVLGATGDLFRKKLAPSLAKLFKKELLPKKWRLVGFSRRPFNDSEFREFLKTEVDFSASGLTPTDVDDFLSRTYYVKGDLENVADYHSYTKRIADLDLKDNLCSHKLLYLAVSPIFYKSVVENIAKSGLAIPCVPELATEAVWNRVLIEKPFGGSLDEARALDKHLSELFTEEQIFRIDHYLAKETMRHILGFRFDIGAFESVWNGKMIEQIHVRLFEAGTVGTRGAFYDGVGALRDVGQNHLLQMLSILLMDKPRDMEAVAIRSARSKALASLIPPSDISSSLRLGQYDGFTNEKGVSPTSNTETYFKLHTTSLDSRWSGTEITIEGGKGMPKSLADSSIVFRPHVLDSVGREIASITFHIQPKEQVEIIFRSGENEKHEIFTDNVDDKILKIDAYERVLLDAFRGDQTLFASTDEVSSAWRFITPILENKGDLSLEKYKAGEMPVL